MCIMKNSKYKDEIEAFKIAFFNDNRKKILYGTGRKTAVLQESFDELNVVGLSDRDPKEVGQYKYGRRILDRFDAERLADIVIINTAKQYWYTIYQRIKDWKLPIYYNDGTRATDFIKAQEDDEYWKQTIEKIKQNILEYDVVSFDLFDTLICRRVCYATDIFSLLEIRTGIKGLATARKNAEMELDNPTLTDIYDYMFEGNIIKASEIGDIIKSEMQIDRTLMMPRNEMIELCGEILSKKDVWIISDMYYPASFLLEILSSYGLTIEKNRMIVSCEKKGSKKDGDLWRYYREEIVKNKKAIHIGDNIVADGERPKTVGVDSILVRNPCELADRSSLKNADINNTTIEESLSLGFVYSGLFNNPFILTQTRGRVTFFDEIQAGYYLLGGVIWAFNNWLYKKILTNGIKTLFFIGRDGYLLKREFDEFLVGKDIEDDTVFQTFYVECSRVFLWLIDIRNKADIFNAINEIPFQGNYRELFKGRFGIEIDDDIGEETYDSGSEIINVLVNKYEESILKRAIIQRDRYKKYINSFDAGKGRKAVVDIGYYGSIQYHMKNIIGEELDGFYMTANQKSTNHYCALQRMQGCFGNTDECSESNIYKRSIFMEAFYTAPNGMFIGINENGKPVYEKKLSNQRHFDVRYDMDKGIRKCGIELSCLQRDLMISFDDPQIWNRIFEMFMDEGFIPSKEMVSSFYRDDVASTTKEFPIWEIKEY